MGRSGIERRELLTALTAGLLSACGIKPEQAPVQRLPEIPPISEPTPAETVTTPNIEHLIIHPRLQRWRVNLWSQYRNSKVAIHDYGDNPVEGKIKPVEGLKTRNEPSIRGSLGPLWTWFLPSDHPEWNPAWTPEFRTVIQVDYWGDNQRVETWAVLTSIKRPRPSAEQPVEFPLFSAMRRQNFDSQGNRFVDEELMTAELPQPHKRVLWNVDPQRGMMSLVSIP